MSEDLLKKGLTTGRVNRMTTGKQQLDMVVVEVPRGTTKIYQVIASAISPSDAKHLEDEPGLVSATGASVLVTSREAVKLTLDV